MLWVFVRFLLKWPLYSIDFRRVFRELFDNIQKIYESFIVAINSFYTENIRTLVFRTDDISFGPNILPCGPCNWLIRAYHFIATLEKNSVNVSLTHQNSR